MISGGLMHLCLFLVLFAPFDSGLLALARDKQDPADLKKLLSREIVGPHRGMDDVQAYIEPRIPSMPDVRTLAEWEKAAEKIRKDALEKVVFRGEAAKWRLNPTNVEWMGDLDGGTGYKLRKLRFE